MTAMIATRRLWLVWVLLLGACGAPAAATSTPAKNIGTATVTEAPVATHDQPALELIIWLPPQFDPAGTDVSAGLLQARIEEFAAQHSQLRVEMRVKAEEGTGGLFDSLLRAHQAAPLALPDLVLLPHLQLPNAVNSQLVVPLQGLVEEATGEDWYGFARQMASVEEQAFAVPFAADALVLAYRPSAVDQLPASWSALLNARVALGFAAADNESLFTLHQLFSASPENQEEVQLPFGQTELADTFDFLAAGQERGVFPFWLTQFQTSDQSWQAFSEGRVPMVAAWTSRTFDSRNVDIAAAPLPTNDGEPFALVQGWVWTITTPHDDRAPLAAELAEYLTTPEFLAQWSSAAGMLPARHSSLAAWAPDEKQALAIQIADVAMALPDQMLVQTWGPPLSEAVSGLLKQELTPEQAMQLVMGAVTNPEN